MNLSNKSGYKGVRLEGRTGRWKAGIKVKGKERYLGTFGEPSEAAIAYDKAASELFGEFAVLNFPSSVG
jgi:hypothetical protein